MFKVSISLFLNLKMRKSLKFEEGGMFMTIELPRFEHPIYSSEIIEEFLKIDDSYICRDAEKRKARGMQKQEKKKNLAKIPKEGDEPKESLQNESNYITVIETALTPVPDLEVDEQNPSEEKHLVLSVSALTEALVHRLIPTKEEKKKIERILNYPPLHEISINEKGLLWKYRYYLRTNKKALVKFLRIVHWESEKESKEAAKLIDEWDEISTSDALALLSRFFQNNDVVRGYAVKILQKADDEVKIIKKFNQIRKF